MSNTIAGVLIYHYTSASDAAAKVMQLEKPDMYITVTQRYIISVHKYIPKSLQKMFTGKFNNET